MAFNSSVKPANVESPSSSSVRSNLSVFPTFPATGFSTLTAATGAVPCVPCVLTPPAIARLGAYLAKSRASRVVVAAGTSVCCSTTSGAPAGSAPWSAARSAAAGPRPSATMTCAIPSASANSVPGLAATHSSALAPESESRGSTVTKWPPPCARRPPAAGGRGPRLDRHEVAAAVVAPRAHRREAARLRDRRDERLQEVRAERDHAPRRGDVVVRHHVEPERGPVRGAHGLVGERLPHDVPAVLRGGELAGERAHRAGLVAGEEHVPPLRRGELRAHDRECRFPGGALPRRAVLDEWGLKAVGVVEALEPGLPARAQAPLAQPAQRVPRFARERDRAALALAHQRAAAGGALAADARVVVGHAREDVLRSDQVRDQLLGGRGRAAGGDAGDADAHQLQEVPSRNDHRVGHGSSSGGRPDSPWWLESPGCRGSCGGSPRTSPS